MSNTVQATAPAVTAPAAAPEKIAGAFYVIWLGQFISMVGTHLTGFALGVWLFQRTGSVLDFSQLTLFATLPALLLMPWSGSLADRWDRRTILILCEAVALLATGCMALLFWLDRFEVWQLMALQGLLSVSLAFQGPAAFSTITALVPKSQFAKAGGLFQIASAIAQFGGPLMAASILGVIGITGIATLDAASYAIALGALLLARFPALARTRAAAGEGAQRRNAMRDMEWAFNYLVERPSMGVLYLYTTLGSFLSGIVVTLIAPLVLTHHSEKVLAWVSTSGAVGVLASGLVLVVWGGPKRFTPLVLAIHIVQGAAIAAAGWFNDSVAILCACAFVAMCSSSTLAGYVSTVWRRKVPRERQGSFAALQQAVALGLIPFAALIGGTLAHYVFEPGLAANGFWHDSVGAWFGTGRGRGTALLFFVVGIGASIVALVSLCQRSLYRFEDDVADAL